MRTSSRVTASVGALLLTAAAAAPALAQSSEPTTDRGMARMHEQMMSEHPGMARMHERMMSGDHRGMARMHEQCPHGAEHAGGQHQH